MNGQWDTGESVIPGWNFEVNGNGLDLSVQTGTGGVVFTSCLPLGNYSVSESVPSGWAATTSTSQIVTVTANNLVEARFGNVQIPQTSSTTTTISTTSSTATTSSTTTTTLSTITTTPSTECNGNLSLIANTNVCPNNYITIKAAGLSVACRDPNYVKFYENGCSGTELARCSVGSDGTCLAAILFTDTKPHTIYGCFDFNGDGNFTSPGENASITISPNCNNCDNYSCPGGICSICSQCSGTNTNPYNASKCVNLGQSCSYSCVAGQCGASSCSSWTVPTSTTTTSSASADESTSTTTLTTEITSLIDTITSTITSVTDSITSTITNTISSTFTTTTSSQTSSSTAPSNQYTCEMLGSSSSCSSGYTCSPIQYPYYGGIVNCCQCLKASS